MIRALQRKKRDGCVYTRRPEIECLLGKLAALPPGELIARCEIENAEDPVFVPDECLLYFVRSRRSEGHNPDFERLYKLLLDRLLGYLGSPGETKNGKIARQVFDEITLRLMRDRQSGYLIELDYAEVNFMDYLKRRKLDAARALRRHEYRSVELDLDAREGGMAPDHELAAGLWDPFDSREMEREDYRNGLDAAIDQLRPVQQRIITLRRLGFPFTATDPQVQTIAKLTNLSPKSVYNEYTAACMILRDTLSKGGAQ